MTLNSDAIRPVLSLVIPAFREENNIPVLYARIVEVLEHTGLSWECIFVDDHSPDNTFNTIQSLSSHDSRVIGLRLSRNMGSDTAIMCGLDHAHGECVVFLAADLQDPPELIPQLIDCWRKGAQIVGAVRAKREGIDGGYKFFAGLYYAFMRQILGMKEIPATGADFFLLDRKVVDVLRHFKESDLCICALISWIGFRQEYVPYTKLARMHGISNQTMTKILRRILDSVTSFTYLPLRLISVAGMCVSIIGFLYAFLIIFRSLLFDAPVQGWPSLMVVVLLIGGIQMLMMGFLGEYLRRTLDESRKRPFYMIERDTLKKEPHELLQYLGLKHV